MIDINEEDVVLTRHASDGRFLLFTRTDLPAGCPIPWWGVTVDTGSDGIGILVRLDDRYAGEGWTATELLHIAVARAMAERKRTFPPGDGSQYQHLRLAALTLQARQRPDGAVPLLRPGPLPSPYPWTDAVQAGATLPLCPDPDSLEEGITPEQLLIILDQLLADAGAVLPTDRSLRTCRSHVLAALAFELRRLARYRTGG